jgi:capsid portal protein
MTCWITCTAPTTGDTTNADDWYGLARQFGYASWHQSALFFKRNVLAGCFIPHKLLSRQVFSAFALDWFVFGNGYLEMRKNRLASSWLS